MTKTSKKDLFISWSGIRSRSIAQALCDWLPLVLPNVVPWMSDANIEKGERWSVAVGTRLAKSELGICCVTPENTSAPWLLFEAGAISKSLNDSRLFPILLGLQPTDLSGPLTQFQATVLEQDDMLRFIKSINRLFGVRAVSDQDVENAFNHKWGSLVEKMEASPDNRVDQSPDSMEALISAMARHGISNPTSGAHTYFAEGFESHNLYDAVFEIAKERILILGRKNRKAFQKDHRSFHAQLKSKLMSGFDFRCLFLDPAASTDILRAAHNDPRFPNELAEAISNARQTLVDHGVQLRDIARVYTRHRTTALLVVDNAVLFTSIDFDASGRAAPLTKTSFSVVNANAPLGRDLLHLFDQEWNTAAALA